MMYVTDTHAFAWFLTGSNKLTATAKEIFEGAETGKDTIIIPTIVLAELMYICYKKNFSTKFNDVLQKIGCGLNYIIYNLDFETIVKANKLGSISNIHDRIMVATALLINAPLITSDKHIINSKLVNAVW